MEKAGPSKGSLKAGSKRKMEFDFKRKFFEKVAKSLTCTFCETVPKKGPLYNSKDGKNIACSDCNDRFRFKGAPMICTENILEALPLAACRYRKNNCKVVQDSKNISFHEEDCEFRDVPCIIALVCDKDIPLPDLPKHCKKQHDVDIENSKFSVEGSKIIVEIPKVVDLQLQEQNAGRTQIFIQFNGKKFVVQVDNGLDQSAVFQACLQMYGSKFEAKNYNYSIQLQSNENCEELGTIIYKGPVKSLDDDLFKIIESKVGLIVPFCLLEQHIVKDENKVCLVIEIENLKSKDDEMDRDSQASNEGE